MFNGDFTTDDMTLVVQGNENMVSSSSSERDQIRLRRKYTKIQGCECMFGLCRPPDNRNSVVVRFAQPANSLTEDSSPLHGALDCSLALVFRRCVLRAVCYLFPFDDMVFG